MKRKTTNDSNDKKSPSPSPSKKKTLPNEFVKKYLDNALAKIKSDQLPMFGDLTEGKLIMPRSSTDGRVLTWAKSILTVSQKIVNKPTCPMDCWFVKANHENVDHITKLSKDGSKNKWVTVRMLYVILHPDELSKVDNRSKTKDLYCLHRCGKGKGEILCINPNHIKLDTSKQNRHDERCGHSCQALCPHKSFPCVFTWKDTGLLKPCFNKDTYNSEACKCKPKCSHLDSVNEDENELEKDDEQHDDNEEQQTGKSESGEGKKEEEDDDE